MRLCRGEQSSQRQAEGQQCPACIPFPTCAISKPAGPFVPATHPKLCQSGARKVAWVVCPRARRMCLKRHTNGEAGCFQSALYGRWAGQVRPASCQTRRAGRALCPPVQAPQASPAGPPAAAAHRLATTSQPKLAGPLRVVKHPKRSPSAQHGRLACQLQVSARCRASGRLGRAPGSPRLPDNFTPLQTCTCQPAVHAGLPGSVPIWHVEGSAGVCQVAVAL